MGTIWKYVFFFMLKFVLAWGWEWSKMNREVNLKQPHWGLTGMVSRGNYPQVTLFQVSEISNLPALYIYLIYIYIYI